MRQSEITPDKPKVTGVYPKNVTEATVKVTGDGLDEPISKKLTFKQGGDGGQGDGGQQKPPPNDGTGPDDGNQGGQQPDQKQIQVQGTQDKKNPRLITLKAVKFPEGVDKLLIDWGVQETGNTPKELTKKQPEVKVKFSDKTKRITVTVDDENNPDTEPWVRVFKFQPGIPEDPQTGEPAPGQGSPSGGGQQGGSGSGSSGGDDGSSSGSGQNGSNSGGGSGSGQSSSGGSQGGGSGSSSSGGQQSSGSSSTGKQSGGSQGGSA